MMQAGEGPRILISSSYDVREARLVLSEAIRDMVRAREASLRPFLYEEETDNGERFGNDRPVQLQIDEMLAGRIALTIVMFGERIGEPMRGEPPDAARRLVDEWDQHGLCHPWPAEADAQAQALAEGKFPLTGTVYELLTALSELKDMAMIGYVADREPGSDTSVGDIKFNGGKLYAREVPPGSPLSPAVKDFEATRYRPQVQALLNLLKALVMRKGLFLRRFSNETEMARRLAKVAVDKLVQSEGNARQPFKPNFEHYRYGDPLPLPDRVELQERLRQCLLEYGDAGEMMLLEGPSGCGKSSLLQKGLLEHLPFRLQKARVAVFRPTDLSARHERTPFLKVLGLVADALERQGVAGLVLARSPAGADNAARIVAAADAIEAALDAADTHLVLGIDQFEEIVDLAERDERRRDTAASWWQVMRLFGALAQRRRIVLVGTLESLRSDKVDELGLREGAGLVVRTENVDFPVYKVRDYVAKIAGDAGLNLSRDLMQDIQRMVQEFEDGRPRDSDVPVSASFLPLLSIWMHRLFLKFQDRMGEADAGAADDFGRAARAITRDDLAERGIDLKLGHLVGELVGAAWEEAGQLERRQVAAPPVVETQAELRRLITFASHTEDLVGLVGSCATPQGFDVARFLAGMAQYEGEIPGFERRPIYEMVPPDVTLDNFFSATVSVDRRKTMRLTDIPETSSVEGIDRLIAAYRRRRLLVPAGPGRLRLVHQAVVDNWPPAYAWFAKTAAILELVHEMERIAEDVDTGYRSIEAVIASRPDIVVEAARVLDQKRALLAMSPPESLTARDALLKRVCLSILSAAPDGLTWIDFPDGGRTTIAHTAAFYDLADPLDRWLAANPELRHARSEPTGITLLGRAAWAAPRATAVLLRHGCEVKAADAENWQPITAAIHSARMDIFDQLIGAYDSPLDIVGPARATLLHEASRTRDAAILKRLLARAPDCAVLTEYGDTPLHISAANGSVAGMRLLMEVCDPGAINEMNQTPLHSAIVAGQADYVAAFVSDDNLPERVRDAILAADGLAETAATPLCLAAIVAQPGCLKALLSVDDPARDRHRIEGSHPVTLAILANREAAGNALLADRVADCVRHLLEDGRLAAADAAEARAVAENLPDVRRMIDEWLIARENFDGVPEAELLKMLVASKAATATTLLTKVPGILDMRDSAGDTGAALLVRRGDAATIAAALAHGIAPAGEPDLFRLQAAVRLIRDGFLLPDRMAHPVHPLVGQILSGEAEEHRDALYRAMLHATGFRGLLHQLALHNEIKTFHAVVAGLAGPVPADGYGRPPSALAPPSRRATFAAVEAETRREMQ